MFSISINISFLSFNVVDPIHPRQGYVAGREIDSHVNQPFQMGVKSLRNGAARGGAAPATERKEKRGRWVCREVRGCKLETAGQGAEAEERPTTHLSTLTCDFFYQQVARYFDNQWGGSHTNQLDLLITLIVNFQQLSNKNPKKSLRKHENLSPAGTFTINQKDSA